MLNIFSFVNCSVNKLIYSLMKLITKELRSKCLISNNGGYNQVANTSEVRIGWKIALGIQKCAFKWDGGRLWLFSINISLSLYRFRHMLFYQRGYLTFLSFDLYLSIQSSKRPNTCKYILPRNRNTLFLYILAQSIHSLFYFHWLLLLCIYFQVSPLTPPPPLIEGLI